MGTVTPGRVSGEQHLLNEAVSITNLRGGEQHLLNEAVSITNLRGGEQHLLNEAVSITNRETIRLASLTPRQR